MTASLSARNDLHSLLGPIAELAANAGGKILEIAKGDLGTSRKQDKSPVTAADVAAEDLLREGLAKLLPGVPFIGEESVERGHMPEPGREFLLIDPLDGTREFIAGRDEYTVNIGLVSNGVPVLGVIYAPANRIIHAGAQGRALRVALAPGAKFDAYAAERIRARERPAELVAAVSRSFLEKRSEDFLATLPVASRLSYGSSVKFTFLAEGKADVYPRFAPICEWDVAAGHALLSAAGGRVEQIDGAPMTYGARDQKFRFGGFVAWGA